MLRIELLIDGFANRLLLDTKEPRTGFTNRPKHQTLMPPSSSIPFIDAACSSDVKLLHPLCKETGIEEEKEEERKKRSKAWLCFTRHDDDSTQIATPSFEVRVEIC